MPNRLGFGLSCWRMAESGASALSTSCVAEPIVLAPAWRMFFLLSPETRARGAPVWPLFEKELREIVSGRALWTLLLLAFPLVGYSFFQGIALYAEQSAAADNLPVAATNRCPLDGIFVPTL